MKRMNLIRYLRDFDSGWQVLSMGPSCRCPCHSRSFLLWNQGQSTVRCEEKCAVAVLRREATDLESGIFHEGLKKESNIYKTS